VRTLVLLLLTCACDAPDPDPPPPPPPPPPDEARFDAEPAAGPALRLEGEFTGDILTVDVVADELGSVFGVAARLTFASDHLAVADAQLTDLLGERAELLRVDDGAVVIGIARKEGEAIADGVLATVRFDSLRPGDSSLALTRAMVRRADGSFVPAAFLGASVHTAGGAR
jgi:hypothetical protein